jgi:hypothetical protein
MLACMEMADSRLLVAADADERSPAAAHQAQGAATHERDLALATRHRLAVDDAGARAQLGERPDDQREAVGEVVARPAVELHPVAALAGDDPEAVVLDLVQPIIAGGRLRG